MESTIALVRVPQVVQEPQATTALRFLQNPSTGARLLQEGPAEKDAFVSLQITYGYVVHSLVRLKWRSKHKIPGWQKLSPDSRENIETYAEFFKALLELCLQLYSGQPEYASGYEWFAKITEEWRNQDFKSILEPKDAGKKAYLQRHRRQILGSLRSLQNPYDPKESPHQYRLVAAAKPIADREDRFRKDYWIPFHRAYTAHIKRIEQSSSWAWMFQEDDRLYYHPGKGRAKRGFYPRPETNKAIF